MSMFYVDLSIVSGGLGIQADPFGVADLLVHTNLDHSSIDHTYFLRGARDCTNDIDINLGSLLFNVAGSNSFAFSAWDLSLYGPWRLKSSVIDLNRSSVIEGGIIETSADLHIAKNLAPGTARNMFIRALGGSIKGPKFEGCTLITEGSAVITTSSPTLINDCIVRATISNIAFVTMTNSVSTLKDEFGIFALGNNQLGWLPYHLFPAWNAGANESTQPDDSRLWKYSFLGSGIRISGSGTFTDYPEGLFGETRIGVGCCNFNALPSGVSWAYFNDLNDNASPSLRKKHYQSGVTPSPTIIEVPPTSDVGVKLLREDDRDVDPSKYTTQLLNF